MLQNHWESSHSIRLSKKRGLTRALRVPHVLEYSTCTLKCSVAKAAMGDKGVAVLHTLGVD